MLLQLFERFTQALPDREAEQPPEGLWAFCRHYTRGFELPLIGLSLSTATIAMGMNR